MPLPQPPRLMDYSTADRQYAMASKHSDSFTGVVSFNRAQSFGSQMSGSSRLSRVPSSAMHRQKSESLDSSNTLRKRRGCNKCISCVSLREHIHSESARTKPHENHHWWPGNIFSPVVYFSLRSRQLEHHARTVTSESKIWRKPQDMVRVTDGTCARRGLSLRPLLIPITHTNVAYRTPGVILTGVKTIQISRVPESHYATPDQQMPFSINPKRRCVSNETYPWEDINRDTQGQQISLLRPSDAFKQPGVSVPQKPCVIQSPFVNRPRTHQPHDGVYLGKVLDSHMPFASAGSPREDSLSVEMHHDSSVVKNMVGSGAQKSAKAGSPPSADASDRSEDEFYMLPVLHSLQKRETQMNVDDPTMQQYYAKQYAIKKEQAFHCHEVIDVSSIAPKEHHSFWTRIKNNLTHLAEW